MTNLRGILLAIDVDGFNKLSFVSSISVEEVLAVRKVLSLSWPDSMTFTKRRCTFCSLSEPDVAKE